MRTNTGHELLEPSSLHLCSSKNDYTAFASGTLLYSAVSGQARAAARKAEERVSLKRAVQLFAGALFRLGGSR